MHSVIFKYVANLGAFCPWKNCHYRSVYLCIGRHSQSRVLGIYGSAHSEISRRKRQRACAANVCINYASGLCLQLLTEGEGADRGTSRLFHAGETATWNARSPKVDRWVGETLIIGSAATYNFVKSISGWPVLFHGQELSLETDPSLLPVRQYETVCLSPSDQLRLLLVLSASWKPICSIFRFNWISSFINIVMPNRSVFVVGWALN